MMMHQFLSACLLACALLLIPVFAQPTVNTTNGALLGITRVVQQGGSNLSVDIFYTIPFAKPPVGNLRFSKPEASEPWSGVRNAYTPGPWCPQLPSFPANNYYTGQEDCLYLNVYTPKVTKPSQGLPVMLFIHGGSFYQGSGVLYDAAQVSANGVVVVIINYRLGVLGFLSTLDNVSPGNYGLYDQLMALRWVRDNIQAFGGNPNDVTLFGESAGAVCTSLLFLSPEAKGLFSKVIVESGSSLAPWAVGFNTTEPQPLNVTKTLASKLNCPVDDHTSLLACLKTKDAEAIIRTHMIIEGERQMQITARPVVEGTFGQAGLLSDIPENLLKTGLFNKNVTVILGFNKDEGTFGLGYLDPTDQGFTVERYKNLTREFVRRTVLRAYPHLDLDTVTDEVLKTYGTAEGSVNDLKRRRGIYFQMITDSQFWAPTYKEMSLIGQAADGPTKYMYLFSYRSAHRANPEWMGVTHADEIYYVSGLPLTALDIQLPFVSNWTDDDKTMAQKMTRWWTDYAKHGNPTPNATASEPAWLPWTQATPKLFKIDVEQRMEDAPLSAVETAKIRLWNDVIPKLSTTSGSPAAAGRFLVLGQPFLISFLGLALLFLVLL